MERNWNIRTIKSLFGVLFFATVLAFLTECANPVTPVGGPQDVTPPSVVKAEPPLLSRNFKAEKVRIYFDEFVEFKDVNQQVVISPPMNEKPDFKIKGRSVVIEFNEELKDSTTYNIFFGNSIVDLTENNPIANFQYVFATGDVLDSLTFKGNIKDAFNLEPLPDLNVMLYLDNNDTIPFDSLPYLVKPYYYSRTAENGDFTFNNLMDKKYKLFALEDANGNMRFDQVTERIAFIDSLITPYYIPPLPEIDTIADSTAQLADSLMIEEVIIPEDTAELYIEPTPIALFLFQETDSVQRFIKASLVKPGKLMFVFKAPTISPEIFPVNYSGPADWFIEEKNTTRDTINYWIRSQVPDTMVFIISDLGKVLDTIEISTIEKQKGKKNKDEEKKPERLIVKFTKNTELNTPQKIKFNYPLKSFLLEGSMLVENEDTLNLEFQVADSLGLVGEIIHKWKESSSYHILIPDSSFFGLGDQSHDTLEHNLKIRALADYGNLKVNVSLSEPGVNHIIQFMKKEKVLHEIIISEDSEINFNYLLPDDYVIKVIIDRNNNRKWDTGHYMQNIQPETVSYFPKTITIRANWDIVEEWQIGEW